MDLKVGMPAPDFTLPLATFGTVALSNMRGKPVILYFYPKDDTPGCTTQACEFRDSLPRFADFDAAVIGISKDTVESHAAFARKFGLNFHLASDAHTHTCEDYGVWVQKSVYGEPTMGIERTTFLIDRHGIIRYIWRKVTSLGHAEDVRAMTEALHHGQPLPGENRAPDPAPTAKSAPASPVAAVAPAAPAPKPPAATKTAARAPASAPPASAKPPAKKPAAKSRPAASPVGKKPASSVGKAPVGKAKVAPSAKVAKTAVAKPKPPARKPTAKPVKGVAKAPSRKPAPPPKVKSRAKPASRPAPSGKKPVAVSAGKQAKRPPVAPKKVQKVAARKPTAKAPLKAKPASRAKAKPSSQASRRK